MACFGKKNSAPWSAMIQCCRNRIGHVIAVPSSPDATEQVPKRVGCFILRAIGNLIIEWAQLLGAITDGGVREIVGGKPEHFDEGMGSCFCHEGKV